MPEYNYRAKDGPEKVVEGVIEALSESAAIDRITNLGYTPIAVHEKTDGEGRSASVLLFRSKRQIRRQVMFFSRHLGSLFKSGIPVLRALMILSEQEKDPYFRDMLEAIAEKIRQGSSFSGAIREFPGFFPSMYVSVVASGEGSGALAESLTRMAVYLKKAEELRNKVTRAMAYPILLLLAGIGTIFFLVTFVVPRLATLFLNMNQDLPWPTKVILGLGDFMSHTYLAWILAGVFVWVFWQWLLSKRQGRSLVDQLKLQMPFFGEIVLKTDLARFARTMEISLSNGISFLNALLLSAPTLANSRLYAVIEGCYEKVERGDSFGACLRQDSFFPIFMSDLILIGEESGKLEEALNEVAETYEQDVDEKIMMLTTLLEPIMILGIGLVIGFIVMGMLLPIFEMNIGL